MHLLSIPRHQIETTLADYAGIAASLLTRREGAGAIAAFERDFADYVGCRHAIAVASGRLGMHLVLEALEIGPGNEAIIPAFNLFAVVERFCQLGLIPRFCDIRGDDLNIDASAAERLVTSKTRIVLATHMFGHPAAMDALTAMARQRKLILLEDCAHALGSRFAGKFVGTLGTAAIFSFSVLKLVTTFGGGMIATNDGALAASIRKRLESLRESQPCPRGVKKALMGAIMDIGTRRLPFSFGAWPMLRLARMLRPGLQQKIMTETPRRDRGFHPEETPPLHPFQARLGRGQLHRVGELIERRRRVGQWLDEELDGIPHIRLVQSAGGGTWNGLYYGILANRAAELSQHLFSKGIDCETSEYHNCADLDLYRDHAVDCPVAREVQSQIIRLPNFPAMTQRDVRRVGSAIRRFYA